MENGASELSRATAGLKRCSEALIIVADAIRLLADRFDVATNDTPPAEPKPVTLEQVRAVLAEKSRSGRTAEVRELLKKHGVTKLSEINHAEFETLLGEAANIGLGEGENG